MRRTGPSSDSSGVHHPLLLCRKGGGEQMVATPGCPEAQTDSVAAPCPLRSVAAHARGCVLRDTFFAEFRRTSVREKVALQHPPPLNEHLA